jgi:uncharacterized protein with HEPN domain
MFSAAKREAWLGRVDDVLAAIDRVEAFLRRTFVEAFRLDEWAVGAVAYQLIIMAEATKAMAPGIEQRHPDFPWLKMWGMRNVLAHEYGRIDPEIVWAVASDRFAPLRAAMLAERDWLEAQ